MTPQHLRTICNSLNPGGQSKLARMLGISPRSIRRKLAGKSPISKEFALAVTKALELMDEP